MSIELGRHALLWCAVINYILLAIWSILFVLPHEWLYRFSARRFRLNSDFMYNRLLESEVRRKDLAPQVGFELTTQRLTAARAPEISC